MFAVFLDRGPWGVLHARRPDSARASLVIHALAELPPALARVNGARAE
jgi:hypothetical protein